jgi:hypothetical protein
MNFDEIEEQVSIHNKKKKSSVKNNHVDKLITVRMEFVSPGMLGLLHVQRLPRQLCLLPVSIRR